MTFGGGILTYLIGWKVDFQPGNSTDQSGKLKINIRANQVRVSVTTKTPCLIRFKISKCSHAPYRFEN